MISFAFELWHSCPIVQSFEFWPLQKQTAWTKPSTGWLNTSSIQVLLVFNDHPLLIIQASGITKEKFFSAVHKRPSFCTGGLLWFNLFWQNSILSFGLVFHHQPFHLRASYQIACSIKIDFHNIDQLQQSEIRSLDVPTYVN